MTTANKSKTDEVIALEKKYWQAVKDRDKEMLSSLTADPCIVAGSSGAAMIDMASFKKIVDSANYELKKVSFEDFQAKEIGADTVILAYKVHEELVVDGAPVTLHAADSSVWHREGDKWTCTLHTESVLGDAYGRDRKQTK